MKDVLAYLLLMFLLYLLSVCFMDAVDRDIARKEKCMNEGCSTWVN